MRIRDQYADFTQSMYESYLAIRKAIGILGMSLPLLIILLGALIHQQTADSLSGYYHTSLRDLFVAILFGAGLLLIVYQGDNLTDKYLTTAAGILAILTVVFPTKVSGPESEIANNMMLGIFQLQASVSWICHIVFALSFFLVMSFICLFRFTRHRSNSPNERIRLDFQYKVCGLFILAGAIFSVTVKVFFRSYMQFYPVLVVESISLGAIGYGWFLKGNKKSVRKAPPRR